MASEKELGKKIKVAKTAEKLTRAMGLAAAAKLRKAQLQMNASRPYAIELRRVINRILGAQRNYEHPYLEQREIKSVGYLVISTDRGLCGCLNANLFKTLLQHYARFLEKKITIQMGIFGEKAVNFFNTQNFKILAQRTGLGDKLSLTDIIGPVQVMLQAYLEGQIDALFLSYNRFESVGIQRPIVEQLLPLALPVKDESAEGPLEYIYEPNAESLLPHLFSRMHESFSYQAMVENLACEQAARMVAMENAASNTADLLDELQVIRNKLRQASITQELTEIVAGATVVGI